MCYYEILFEIKKNILSVTYLNLEYAGVDNNIANKNRIWLSTMLLLYKHKNMRLDNTYADDSTFMYDVTSTAMRSEITHNFYRDLKKMSLVMLGGCHNSN